MSLFCPPAAAAWPQQSTGRRLDNESLTSSLILHNYVEARGGRFTQPIPSHGLPCCQLFSALKSLKFEVAKKMLIATFEINVDLSWE